MHSINLNYEGDINEDLLLQPAKAEALNQTD